jgi:phospholipid/cholesterol/gamma-HCH transport system substrate-binding protein
MRVRGLLSLLAFTGIIVFSLNYFGSLGVRIKPPPQRTNLSMEVPDINGLVVGANVLLRGVPVGKISQIATTVEHATVEFYVDDRYQIPADSNVRLENLSALGETYIGLVPRSASGPILRNGQRIAAWAVSTPPSISELATTVGRILHQLDPPALQRIIGEADAALPDPTAVLPNLRRASVLLRNTAAHMRGKGRELLDNFQTLLTNAGFVGPVLAGLAPYIRHMGSDIENYWARTNEEVRIGAPQIMRDLQTFLRRIEKFLDHRSGDLRVLTESMLPYLNDISGALMNLDTGQMLANMLAAVPEDGVVTLHVSTPEK